MNFAFGNGDAMKDGDGLLFHPCGQRAAGDQFFDLGIIAAMRVLVVMLVMLMMLVFVRMAVSVIFVSMLAMAMFMRMFVVVLVMMM
jgi:hypothetical protein